jgi:dipeptidyl aminopeptidase/acylaminoacyl peptidase
LLPNVPAAAEPADDFIVYRALDTGNGEDSVVRSLADGSGAVAIYPGRSADIDVAVAPNRKKMALTHARQGHDYEPDVLKVMRTDGTGLSVLLRRAYIGKAQWSPDGRKLAVLAAGWHESPRLLRVPVSNSSERRTLIKGRRAAGLSIVAWPKGSGKIYLIESEPSPPDSTELNTKIYLMRSRGGRLKRLDTARYLMAAPNGGKLLTHEYEDGKSSLVMYAGDGTQRKVIRKAAGELNLRPIWAAGGRSFLVVHYRYGKPPLFHKYSRSGSLVESFAMVIDPELAIGSVAFSPDGQLAIFHVMDFDHSNPKEGIYVRDLRTQETCRLVELDSPILDFQFAPSAGYLLVSRASQLVGTLTLTGPLGPRYEEHFYSGDTNYPSWFVPPDKPVSRLHPCDEQAPLAGVP